MKTPFRSLLVAAMLLPDLAVAVEPNEVSMDLAEFLRMYETAKNRPKDPAAAPTPYAISSARYRGEVLLDAGAPVSAEFSGKIHVDVLENTEWVKIPLLPATVALQSAKIGNAEASVVIENGWYRLVTQKRGGFDVDVNFAASVEEYVGAAGLAFELTPSGATEVTLAVPSSEALDFTVANAKVKTDRVDGAKRVVEASIPSTGSLSVRWQREVQTEQVQDPRIYAQVYTLVGIGDGVMQATATVDHTILFAGVQQLKVQIPDGATVLDVRGAGINDWSLGENRVVTVDLSYAAEGAYTLTLDLEKVVGEGDLSLQAPLVTPIGVERSKGWVGVEARGNLEIASAGAKNATSIDVRTLPAAILGVTANPVLLGYKYLGTEAQIPLSVSQHANVDVLVTIVDQARATSMFTVEGRRLTSVVYDVRNNRRQFLRLAMPAGAELWSASVAGKAVQPAKAADGQVLIPLVRSSQAGGALAAFQVEVVYVEEGTGRNKAGAGAFKAELPKADAPISYLGWTVYAPDGAKIGKKSFDGSLRKVSHLSFPQDATRVMTIDAYTPQAVYSAEEQISNGAMGQGAEPVPVSLPLDGTPYTFEKLLALDESLWVSFSYTGLKD